MSDVIDQPTFAKAMASVGVRPGTQVTPEQWKAVWRTYGNERKGTFRSYRATLGDMLRGLRDALTGHKQTEAAAKASLAELDYMRRDAKALGADDVLLRIARRRGHLQSMAQWADFDARQVRRQATALGIDLDERIDR